MNILKKIKQILNMEPKNFDLQRFITAQDKYSSYQSALSEIKSGRKRSHWIWYVFPQIDGLGESSMSKFYGIKCLEEAEAYLEDETLQDRLYEITEALLEQDDTARNILGGIDAMKVRSCMTLFDVVSPNDVFADVLDKFYGGMRDERTLEIIKR